MSDKGKRARTEASEAPLVQDTKKPKRVLSDDAAAIDKAKGGDRLLAMVKRAYTSPLTDEHLSGNSVRVFSVAVMESVHKTMIKAMAGCSGIEEMSKRAEAAVEAKIDATTTPENAEGMRVLKALIAAEKAGTMESDFGMEQEELMGVKVGPLVLRVDLPSGGCMFKILRKVLAIGEKPQVVDRKRRYEDDVAKLLVPRAVMMGKATLKRSMFEEELTVLTAKQSELLLKKKEINAQEDQKGMAIEKMREAVDLTWGTLSEHIPEDGGDGERSALASIKKDMMHHATYALNEATRVLRRDLAATEDFLMRIEAEIEAKNLQLRAELHIEGVLSEDEVRESVKTLYAKSEGLPQIAKIVRNIQELISLPDVVQQGRMLVFLDTREAFDALMGVQPPPANDMV
jgi:hypothetical protein